MKLLISAVAAASALALAAPASATVINFDDLGNGAIVAGHYAEATFSSAGGSAVTTAQSVNYGTSAPNFICSGNSRGSITCTDAIYVDFTNPVSGLSFLAVGDDASGHQGDVKVFGGASLLGTVGMFTDGILHGAPLFVDLSAFSGITRIEIYTTDPAGLGYDDFTFNVGGGSVPEPGVWALMICGFGFAGSALRRRRATAA